MAQEMQQAIAVSFLLFLITSLILLTFMLKKTKISRQILRQSTNIPMSTAKALLPFIPRLAVLTIGLIR